MLSKLANLPVMKQVARKYADKYGWVWIPQESDQCKCIQCFAIYNDAQGIVAMPKPFAKTHPHFRCSLDNHRILKAKTESCPLGRPAR